MNIKPDIAPEALMVAAQEFMMQTREEPVALLIFPTDDGVALLDLGAIQEREMLVEAIKQSVAHTGVTRYFAVCPSNLVSTKDIERDLLSKFNKFKNNPSPEKFHKWLDYAANRLQEAPSKSPYKLDFLITAVFDKHKGSDVLMCSVTKKSNGGFSFGKVEKVSGSMYNRLNIWNPVQVSMGDVE